MTAALTDVAGPSRRRQFAALRALFRQMTVIALEAQGRLSRVKGDDAADAHPVGLWDAARVHAGIPAEDTRSVPSYDQNLPFFMQSGFGKRR